MGTCWSDSKPSSHESEIRIQKKKLVIDEDRRKYEVFSQSKEVANQVAQAGRARPEVIFKKEPKDHVTVYSF